LAAAGSVNTVNRNAEPAPAIPNMMWKIRKIRSNVDAASTRFP
jgi:hypothetical protein